MKVSVYRPANQRFDERVSNLTRAARQVDRRESDSSLVQRTYVGSRGVAVTRRIEQVAVVDNIKFVHGQPQDVGGRWPASASSSIQGDNCNRGVPTAGAGKP